MSGPASRGHGRAGGGPAARRPRLHRPALSRSFHAAFFAAEAALLVLGETRAQHSDVVSAFVRRVVRERALDPRAGRLLRSLFNRYWLADHTYEETPQAEAESAVADAT